jgi:mannitol-1-phosphate 5-dehydrogenase
MDARRLVLVGAGMTGRGQVAQLAHEDGWRLTLVDRDRDLVERLQRAGAYTVRLLGDPTRQVRVDGFAVVHADNATALAAAVTAADLVVTSVLEPNLPDVGRALAAALAPRLADRDARPLNVVAAENMTDSSTVLAGHVRRHLDGRDRAALDARVGFPNSMIARVVPIAADPLFILAEAFSEWTADRLAAVGPPVSLAGLEWVDNQAARLQRKLFIHNAGHAVCGYLGWLRGHRLIDQAARDPEVMAAVVQATAEAGEAISREHGFDRQAIGAYEQNLQGRLVVDALPDDIRRVIRQPLRKLGPDERLLGPLRLCERHGLPSAGLCRGIAAVLACDLPGDEQAGRLVAAVQARGPVAALTDLVGYCPSSAAAAAIEQAFAALTRSAGGGRR